MALKRKYKTHSGENWYANVPLIHINFNCVQHINMRMATIPKEHTIQQLIFVAVLQLTIRAAALTEDNTNVIDH